MKSKMTTLKKGWSKEDDVFDSCSPVKARYSMHPARLAVALVDAKLLKLSTVNLVKVLVL